MVIVVTNEAELARARDLAWAEALSGLSAVAATLAARLKEVHAAPAPDPGQALAAAGSPGRLDAKAPTMRPRGGFGPRQLAVMDLDGIAEKRGVCASDVADTLGYRVPNAHSLLNRLEKLGALERVPDQRPARWRRPAL
jgi:hypothetical protein